LARSVVGAWSAGLQGHERREDVRGGGGLGSVKITFETGVAAFYFLVFYNILFSEGGIARMRVSPDIAFPKVFRESSRSRRESPVAAFSYALEFYLLVAAVFFCSMNYFRISYFYFTVSDCFFLLCLFIATINANLRFQIMGKTSTAIWCFGLSLLLLGLTVSSMSSEDPARGLIVVTQYLYAYFIILLLFGGRTLDELVTLAKVYVFSIVLICLQGVYLIHVDGRKNTAFVSGSGRFSGLMERENECASVIALAVPILLLLISTGRVNKVYACIALPLMIYGVLLTGSNTGLLGLVYGIGIFLLIGMNWKRVVGVAGVAVGLLVLTGSWMRDYLPAIFQKRVLGALETGDLGQAGTFDHRVELIYEALERTGSTMLLGVGADQYRVTSFVAQPVHNIYLLLWTEGGLVSAIGYIVMLCGALGPALVVAKIRGGMPYAACIFAIITLFLVMSNAFPHVYARFWPVPMILPAVLACAYCHKAASETR
jgi:O-antigen ligase